LLKVPRWCWYCLSGFILRIIALKTLSMAKLLSQILSTQHSPYQIFPKAATNYVGGNQESDCK
jgi:hypothetical protein